MIERLFELRADSPLASRPIVHHAGIADSFPEPISYVKFYAYNYTLLINIRYCLIASFSAAISAITLERRRLFLFVALRVDFLLDDVSILTKSVESVTGRTPASNVSLTAPTRDLFGPRVAPRRLRRPRDLHGSHQSRIDRARSAKRRERRRLRILMRNRSTIYLCFQLHPFSGSAGLGDRNRIVRPSPTFYAAPTRA